MPGTFAKLAGSFVAGQWDGAEAFGTLESVGTGELDLRRPYCTGDVDPVVAVRFLQRLPWLYRTIKLDLTIRIFLLGLVEKLLLQALFLAITIGLLLMCSPGLLPQLVRSSFNGTEGASIVLMKISNRSWAR